MEEAGFDAATVSEAAPFEETARLVQRYKEAPGEAIEPVPADATA